MANFNASVPAVWATIEVGVPVSQQLFKGERVSYAWVVLKGSTDARMTNPVNGLPGTFYVESVRVRVDTEIAGKKVSVGIDVDSQYYCKDYSDKNRTVPWLYELVDEVIKNAHEGKFQKEEV